MTNPFDPHKSRLILIDGYNVIRRSPALAQSERISLQHGRDALLTLLVARYGHLPHRLVVVFDGDGRHETHDSRQKLTIVYTPVHETADDCLVRRAHEARARGEEVVICTDDNAIRAALGGLAPQVEHQGARALGQQLMAPSKHRERLYKHRQHVLSEFARDAEPDEAPAARKGNPRRAPKRPRR